MAYKTCRPWSRTAVLSLISVGFGGYYCGATVERWRTNKLRVYAANFESRSELAGQLIPTEPPPRSTIVSQITRFGFPSYDTIRSADDYVLSYDRRNRTAYWVLEHLTKDKLRSNDVNRELCQFTEDESIHPFFRARNEDYFKSGFDRGHLAAARNHHLNQNACQQTFRLSNVAPQVGAGFNRDAWNKLEKHVRHLTKSLYKNVYVCTGPLYLPRRESDGKTYVKYRVIGHNHVAVATHFFKVIVGESADGHLDAECYVMPNAAIDDSVPLSSFQVPIESVERAAGFLLFDKIPKEKFRLINQRRTTSV